MKKAFTLMEVNLAILIMAGGILSILGLYSLGYRENRQSREDVVSAAYADAVMSPLVMALSATNLKWSVFDQIENYPSSGGSDYQGWKAYLDEESGLVEDDPTKLAQEAFDSLSNRIGGDDMKISWPKIPKDMKAGLVILRRPNSAIVKIGFRATRNTAELLAKPIYYTEVRFQGIVD